MIKILFLINTLGGGGAERVLVNLVNNMDTSVFDITVETMFGEGVNAALLHKNIRRIAKNDPCPPGIAYLFRFMSERALYKHFIGNEHYDILVAYMHGAPVKVIAGCPDANVKKIAWLHNGDPATGTFFRFWNKESEAFKAYARCDAVVGVSESVSAAFSKYTGNKKNMRVVYNTNDVCKITQAAKMPADIPFDKNSINLVSVGRLGKEKGYERLLTVCKKLRMEGLPLTVNIIGSGSEESTLRQLIAEQEATDWFHLIGFRDNPYAYVAKADLFVCSSRTEGLSTAVTEAVILGVPVVSTDVSGAKEILGENNEYGIVTENSEEGIFSGIKQMLLNKNNLTYYAQKAKKRASFFATEKTVKEAEDLFKAVLNS